MWKTGGFSAGAEVHDPSVIKDKGSYYIFGTHMVSAKSSDLRTWNVFSHGVNAENELFDNLFDHEEGKEPAAFSFVGKFRNGGYDVWAPDVIYNKVMKKYVMYFCTTSSYIKSCICFATADCVEGPYHYQDSFLFSGYTGEDIRKHNLEKCMRENPWNYAGEQYDNLRWPNCIDPDAFYDKDGKMWLVYGSWSGGIFLLELDQATGYPIRPKEDKESHTDAYYGKKLLGGGHHSIEAPHITYDAKSGWYYLFLSYGELVEKGGYQMRLFRSEHVDGPYRDAAGKEMYTFTDHKDYGLKLMGNYNFPSLAQAYMAPGGQTAFEDGDGKLYVVYHQRFKGKGEYFEPRVHQLFRTREGWLTAAPFAAAGEKLKEEGYSCEEITGTYYLVNHGTDISDRVHEPVEIQLLADGKVTGSFSGTWRAENGTPYFDIALEEKDYTGVILKMNDEAGNEVMCFTAAGSTNECIWGVKYES